jgi:hypothetical protein
VTTSAARYQQLALNPQKLAGQCGKLKCCLNYELDMYIEAIKSYPSQNAKLKTAQGIGAHIKTDIFTGKMWYGFKMPGSPFIMAGFPVDVVRDILAQNKEGIIPEVDLNMADAPVEVEKKPDYENVVGQDDLTRFDSKVKTGKKRSKSKGRPARSVGPAQKALVRPARPAPPASNGPKVPVVTAPGAIADVAGDVDAAVTRDPVVPRHPAHPRRPDAIRVPLRAPRSAPGLHPRRCALPGRCARARRRLGPQLHP